MPATNPYDRRVDRADQRRLREHEHASDGAELRQTPSFVSAQPSALRLEDLEAIARNAHTRGEIVAQERMQHQHDMRVIGASRQAWDGGYEEGRKDGGQALLDAIDEQVGAEVRALHAKAVAINDARARKTKADRELTTVAALLEFAKEVARVTDTLVVKHHDGFPNEIPF